nr:MAG TPA: hypothetical protein [Caudoviricetes sp.]
MHIIPHYRKPYKTFKMSFEKFVCTAISTFHKNTYEHSVNSAKNRVRFADFLHIR